MNQFLKPQTIKWCLDTLTKVPRDQSGLFYFLIFSKITTVQRGKPFLPSIFEAEFYQYFGAPLKGGGIGCYNPLDGRWMAEDYINSTVYGRLLNGSHWWTNSQQGFFDRTPPNQFPAQLKLKSNAFDVLKNRSTYPCLRQNALLPLTAVAVLYYRDSEIAVNNLSDLADVVLKFKHEVLSNQPNLISLFSEGPSGPISPYQETFPSEDEIMAIYPACPYKGESQVNIRLYTDDVAAVKSARGINNDQFSDYFRKLIREKGIF